MCSRNGHSTDVSLSLRLLFLYFLLQFLNSAPTVWLGNDVQDKTTGFDEWFENCLFASTNYNVSKDNRIMTDVLVLTGKTSTAKSSYQ